MSSSAQCRQCGASLPEGVLQGLCPRCLAREAAKILAARPSVPSDELSALALQSANTIRYFGDYELLEEIARGGMGVVWKARQRKLNRIVAVKLLLAGRFASPEFVQRFHAEAKAAANLQHPHIVAIHEVGEHEGQPYFSMGFVEGQSLAERARNNPLPPQLAADYMRTIAQAIHYAHQRGILHRDLKPSNILIDVLDQPRVTDFGLAKRLGDSELGTWSAELTISGQVLGTPQYMSPEQAQGRRGTVTVLSDVYSLGAVLYFLLTGRPPFQAESVQGVIDQLLQTEPVAPRQSNPAVPSDLETICLKCLAKEPRARYATAQELADDLNRFLRGEPIQARPVNLPERLWRWSRRRPLIAGLLVALHVVFAIGLGGVLWQWQLARRAQRETTEKLWDAYLAQARANRLSNAAGRRRAGLDLIAKATAIRPSLELRNEAIATLAMLDVRPGRTWHIENIGDWIPWQFQGDFQRYAVADGTNGIRIRRVSGDVEVAVLRHPSRTVKNLFGVEAFSPNGRYLTARFAEEKHWVVWEVPTARLVLDDPRCEHGVAFSRDGTRFAASQKDGMIRLYELASGAEVAAVKATGPIDWLRLNPTADRVAGCVMGETEIGIWDFATGKAQLLAAPDRLYYADWSTGDLLAAGAATGRIYIWNARSGQLCQIIQAHDSLIQQVTFNHRGDLLASVSWDGLTRFSNPWTGTVELLFPRHAQGLLFSRDDRQFSLAKLALGAKSRFAFLEMDESPVVQRIEGRGNLDHAWSVTFSPDGRWLASASGEDGGMRLYDSRERRLLAALPECMGRIVLFEPGGKSLLTGGAEGIIRWPIAGGTNEPDYSVAFGEPRPISPLKQVVLASLSSDGRWLACTVSPDEVWLLDLTDPDRPILLGRHRSALAISISPDGQWVASGNWHGAEGIKIWQASSRQVVKTIPMGLVNLGWSPDGRWLSFSGTTGSDEFQNHVLAAGSWAVRFASGQQNFTGHTAFSPDSRMVAFLSNGGRNIRLHEVGSFRHLATLEAPSRSHALWLSFSPDGDRLAAQEYRQGIQVWDLARLREELKTRGLDWGHDASSSTLGR